MGDVVKGPFEAAERAQALAHFEAGNFRAALHVWDALEFPEMLTDDEVSKFETARRRQ